MNHYLAMLLDEERKIESEGGGTLKNLKNPVEEGSLGFLGTPPSPFQKVEAVESIKESTSDAPSPVGGEAVTAQQRAFLGRAPLVEEDELHGIQRALMRHLVDCSACNVGAHRYCPDGERIGLGYWAYLFEFHDGDDRHRQYVMAVALARSAGLRAGFNALLRMYTTDGINRLESHLGAAWLAFDEHTATCTGCLRRAGRYCEDGRVLRDAALRERVQ